MRVVNLIEQPKYLADLRHYFNSEWGEGDPYATGPTGKENPPSLCALLDEELIGGLSFTWVHAMSSVNTELWINAVYVVEKHRGNGVASRLLNEASNEATKAGD